MVTVNHRSCRKVRQSLTFGLLICTAICVLGLPIRAEAQLVGKAFATGQFDHNSNVFSVDNALAQPGSNAGAQSANSFSYGAGFDAAYLWGRQQIYATVSGKEYDYQQLSELNHYEYSADTGLKWQLGDLLDGNFDVARTHTMVPFLDLEGLTTLSLLTAQRETFQIGVKLSSEWKLEGSAYTSRSTQPTAGAENQELTETGGTTSIQYAGIGPLVSGLTATYLTGDYGGTNGATNAATTSSYAQSTVGLVTSYKLNRTSFEGQVTYSRRTTDSGLDNVSGLTGLISFQDQLTPKTSFTVKLDRGINTYFLNLGSEIDTDAGFSVNWQATYKTGVSLGYVFTYRAFPGQAQGSAGAYPVDYQQNATFGLSYQPVHWLAIAPYANVQTRRSNTYGRNFDSTEYGLTLTATVGEDRPKR
jgi:hypothetical protein